MEGVFWTLHTSQMLYNKHFFFIAPALFSLVNLKYKQANSKIISNHVEATFC